MASVEIKGVFRTTKKLADGSLKEYWYHRATMTPLPGPKGSAAFLAADKLAPQGTDTVGGLIRVYEAKAVCL